MDERWSGGSCSRTHFCNCCEYQTFIKKKKKSLATNVNLKLMSQRAFSQGKELLNVFGFPNQLRARECETALKSIPNEGKGQRGKNVFNALMFLTCGLPNSPTPHSISVPSLRSS